MEKTNKSKLVAAGNLLTAHTWKGLLETKGIAVELKGEALLGGVGALPTDMQNVELWVELAHFEQAKALLDAVNADGPKWKCVGCHEINEASFELCWNCQSEKAETL